MYNHNHTPTTKFDFLPAIQKSDERQQLIYQRHNRKSFILDKLIPLSSSCVKLVYVLVLSRLASDAITVLDFA